jgi:hypothetical protein
MSNDWTGELGKFGKYCKKHDIDRKKIAEAVGCTTSYISMFAHDKATPGRKCAVNIEIWTALQFGEEDAFKVKDWPREKMRFERAA